MSTEEGRPEAEFASALALFQARIPHIGKGNVAQVKSDKASYSYSYADLTDITMAALPLLAEHGFAWSAKTTVSPTGFLLLSSLKHSGGWSETCEWPLPDPSRSTPQQVGSALTYARRYTFTALTGVAPGGEDDDAQAANTLPAAGVPDPRAGAVTAVWAQAKRLGLDGPAVKDRYAQENGGEVIDDADAKHLHAFAELLSKEGANGLPLRKDGQVALSQITPEERDAAGLMSKKAAQAHKALVEDVAPEKPGPAAAEVSHPFVPGDKPDECARLDAKNHPCNRPESAHVPVDPAEDPWATVTVVQPGEGAA